MDWLMQFSGDTSIKGDAQVAARGASALVVRDMVAQNLMTMLGTFAAHPAFAPLIKPAAALRQLFAAQQLPKDLVKTDEEIANEAQERAGAGVEEDPALALKREELALKKAALNLEAKKLHAEVAIAEMKTAAGGSRRGVKY